MRRLVCVCVAGGRGGACVRACICVCVRACVCVCERERGERRGEREGEGEGGEREGGMQMCCLVFTTISWGGRNITDSLDGVDQRKDQTSTVYTGEFTPY